MATDLRTKSDPEAVSTGSNTFVPGGNSLGNQWRILRISVRRSCLLSADRTLVWRQSMSQSELRRLAALERLRQRCGIVWIVPFLGVQQLMGQTGTLHPFVLYSYPEALPIFGDLLLRKRIAAVGVQARKSGITLADCKAEHIRVDSQGQIYLLDPEGWDFPLDKPDIPPPASVGTACPKPVDRLLVGLLCLCLLFISACGAERSYTCPLPSPNISELVVTTISSQGKKQLWHLQEHAASGRYLSLPGGGAYQLEVTGYDSSYIPLYHCTHSLAIEDNETLLLLFDR